MEFKAAIYFKLMGLNMWRMLLCFIFICCSSVTSYAQSRLANGEEDISGDQYTAEQLIAIQSEVDQGHQPWLTDPVLVAGVFLGSYYKDDNIPDGTEERSGSEAIVTVDYQGKRHTIFLKAPVKPPSDEPEKGGIWVVQRMSISSI